ncbi:hypothetical protein I5Q34_00995 [Streptomyces sp. AV19]|uniref:hypothetical protein n=1 Tax=Streptomyces sp. AV19 TaxID=2793068 RepID=UPI0018FF0064|nr:hypothetical protein [Streptomyces sp. AV19]MBH1932883.1 hypothetical protein [Streptomyces sp. AV19]MDG4531561.1 hypothetical protein [Streptomyces sp. AV19]
MVSVRSALCGALTAVAVGAAPAHALDDPPSTRVGTVELVPVTSRPGADVQLRVSGCSGDRATAVSEAFVTDARLARDTTGHSAEATVRSTTSAGTYPVRVNCDGREDVAEGVLTVVPDAVPDGRDGRGPHDGRDGHDGHAALTGQDHDHEHEHGVPVAPVPAGGGGTAPVAAADTPGTPGLVLGGAGVLIAGVLIWYRRRTDAGRR